MAVSDSPDIPDQSWENPFTPGTFLHDLYGDVVRENRDLVIVLDDILARRGTGKTIASCQLGHGMDQTPEGLTKEKATIHPEELHNAYTSQPKRSALILDEGEYGISNRDAMTKTNKKLREIMSMGRVEEKYVIINAPSKSFLESDIKKLADVWISVVRKGLALVHWLYFETYSEQLLTPKMQWFEFEDVPKGTQVREVYNHLTKEKRDILDGQDGNEYIPVSEHQEKLRQAREEARVDQRNEIIQNLFNHPEIQDASRNERVLNQRVMGEASGLDQSQVSRILNEG